MYIPLRQASNYLVVYICTCNAHYFFCRDCLINLYAIFLLLDQDYLCDNFLLLDQDYLLLWYFSLPNTLCLLVWLYFVSWSWYLIRQLFHVSALFWDQSLYFFSTVSGTILPQGATLKLQVLFFIIFPFSTIFQHRFYSWWCMYLQCALIFWYLFCLH